MIVVSVASGEETEDKAATPSRDTSKVSVSAETSQEIVDDQNLVSAPVKNTNTTETIESPESRQNIATDQNKEAVPSAQQEAPTVQKPLVGTDLFENVYVPYAQKEKPFIFNGVKTFAENCGYEFDVTEPTEEVVGEIKIKSNDDYVYFAFLPNSDDLEIISIVNYFHAASNSEVSLSNYSTDREAQYDRLTTHVIGESDIVVDNVDAQREFLFS